MLWNRVYRRGKGPEAHDRKNLKCLEENVIRNVNVKSALVKFQGLSWWFIWWRICPQCGRPEFDCWVRKIPWRREWLPTPVFLPWEFHGQRSLVGYSPWVTTHTLDTTEQLTVTFAQAEMRNMFLETGSKDLVIKREKTWLNCILCNRK